MTMAIDFQSVLILSLLPLTFLNAVIEKPKNTWVHVGETVTLKCCLPNAKWKKNNRPMYEHFRDVCPNGQCSGNYKLDRQHPGCLGLIVENVSAKNSALYQCLTESEDIYTAAYLIAYECGANKHHVKEGDTVTFRCDIKWKDKPFFLSYWKDAAGNTINAISFNEEQDHYVSELTVTALRSKPQTYSGFLEFQPTSITDPDVDKSTPIATWSTEREGISFRDSDSAPAKALKEPNREMFHSSQSESRIHYYTAIIVTLTLVLFVSFLVLFVLFLLRKSISRCIRDIKAKIPARFWRRNRPGRHQVTECSDHNVGTTEMSAFVSPYKAGGARPQGTKASVEGNERSAQVSEECSSSDVEPAAVEG